MFAVLLELGTVYGWGMGNTNQLGQGDDDDDVYEPVIITGKQLQNKFVYFLWFKVTAVGIYAVVTSDTEIMYLYWFLCLSVCVNCK